MKGLLLHCGASAITRSELAVLPVPEPMGPRHHIRPFIEDVELITDELFRIGMPVKDEGFGVTVGDDGVPRQFFGLMEVEADGVRDHGIMVGVRGSYNQTLPRGVAIGSRVLVCDNLSFSGEIEIKTKQTLDIDSRIRQLLSEAFDGVPGLVRNQDKRFDQYREIRIGQTVGNSLLTDLLRQGVLTSQQLATAIKEWDEPRHPEHAENGWSVWRLHNAVTEAIKPNGRGNAVRRNWARTITLTSVLDAEVQRRVENQALRNHQRIVNQDGQTVGMLREPWRLTR